MSVEELLSKSVTNTVRYIKRKKAKTVIAMFSGGKDSLVSTYVANEACKSLDVKFKVVFIDTTCALPNTIEYVKDVCVLMGWDLQIIKPKQSFWELVLKNGAPSPRRRWCCKELKLKPLWNYLKAYNPPRIVILGLRNGESYRRKKIKKSWFSKDAQAWIYNPIIDWSEGEVLVFINKMKIPVNPNYSKVGFAGDCFCGCFTTLDKIKRTAEAYPEFFMKIVEIEQKFRSGGTFFYIAGKKIRASDFIQINRQNE